MAQADLRIKSAAPVAASASNRLLQSIAAMSSVIPIALLRVWLPVGATAFTYRIELKDGRVWSQTLEFDSAADPKMTFDVPNQWRLSEFQLQRSIRDQIVAIVPALGITEIRWTDA